MRRLVPLAVRLRAKIGSPDSNGCMLWLGVKDYKGYGKIIKDKKLRMAHRLAYEVEIGEIPKGMVIDHLCRVHACCNTQHMEVVTNHENILRGFNPAAINARKTLCSRGHELAITATLDSRGKRICRECAVVWKKRESIEYYPINNARRRAARKEKASV